MLNVTPIACLEDNYAYLLEDVPGAPSGEAMVIDPSEAEPVLAALEASGNRLAAVLCTHHHHDHVGGNLALVRAFPGIKVYGHSHDRGRIPRQTDELEDGATIEWGALTLRALYVPGHTLGAVAYVLEDVVFTGDTLFLAGCGRLFEGTAPMMYESLNQKLAKLGDGTRVFCGHEYTETNLRFATEREPNNLAIASRLEKVRALRREGRPTVGAPLRDELATNPFLRCDVPEIRAAAGVSPDASSAEAFAAIRRARDQFRS